MLNQYPLWKYLLVLAVVLGAALYALPNLYGEDPAVQITAGGLSLEEPVVDTVERTLSTQGLEYKAFERRSDQLLIRFPDTDTQLKAADRIDATLDDRYTVALNLAPATPDWLRAINGKPMYLGLDLRGGVHFLLEVDMEAAIEQAEERFVEDIRSFLRDERLRYMGITRGPEGIRVRFREVSERDESLKRLRREYDDLELEPATAGGTPVVRAVLTDEAKDAEKEAALEQNITTLRNRVNELGVAEPVIQQQGSERIVVQLPGVQDTARAKEILGATATLDFRLVHGSRADWIDAEESGRAPPAARMYERRDGRPILLKRRVIITGDQITDASSGIEQQNGTPAVFISLDGKGARRMSDVSQENIGNLMAVVYKENKIDMVTVNGEEVERTRTVEEVISVAEIRDQLGRRFQISGLDSTREARDLALLLRAGALRAPVQIVEERTIGPSLGAENIQQGFLSVVVGLALVMVFMAVYYKLFGLIADLALMVNLVFIVAVLSLLQATLTLPGIAGIVLTVGMAVDANVLIFQRIREELRNGNTPQAAIHSGYEKAFSTIADANVTTLIAAIVLFAFGTGPIKGFAVTLSIGIIGSMFTAILGTRAVVNLVYGGRRLAKLPI